MNKAYFTQLYVIEGKSYAEIAKVMGWNKSSVSYYRRKYNIPTQDPKQRHMRNVPRGEIHPEYGRRGELAKCFGKKHTEETKQKISTAQRGEKNHRYGKSITPETRKRLSEAQKKRSRLSDDKRKTPLYRAVRILPEYRVWRTRVFERDNWTCQECGKRGSTQLNADHIKPLVVVIKEHNIQLVSQAINCEALWDTNNGRTLCIECHKKTDTYGGKMKRDDR